MLLPLLPHNALIAFGLPDHLLGTDIVVPLVHLTCKGWFLSSVNGGHSFPFSVTEGMVGGMYWDCASEGKG